MGIVKKGVTILHFDETYHYQRKLQSYSHECIDFTDLEGTRLFCDGQSLKVIKRKLLSRKQKGITFIGSGDYHYVTYLLLNEIKLPFTLLLFDHHTDLDDSAIGRNMPISCGSWLSFALKDNPFLTKAIIIGPKWTEKQEIEKVKVIPYTPENHPFILQQIQQIQNDFVYISIDKDVLKKGEAVTNWDQGTMSAATLLFYLRTILNEKKVIGLDVCGEAPRKRLAFSFLEDRMMNKNETINLNILKMCLRNPHVYETNQFA